LIVSESAPPEAATNGADGTVQPAAAGRNDAATIDLLAEARAGRRSALDIIFSRQYNALVRWTRGRLPSWARGTTDTADIVQDALTRVLGRVDRIDVPGKGALAAYLRRSIQNRILDEMRYVGRRPSADLETVQLQDRSPSAFETLVSAQDQERYKAALTRLSSLDRELIVGAVELGYNHEQLALATGKPTPDAARVGLIRAIKRLVDDMKRA
jgi:RNA polymerase sigma factor (sigma-70 family)